MNDLVNKNFTSISLLAVNIVIFINYRLFILTFFCFAVYYIFKNIKLDSINKFLLKIIPLNYFLKSFLATFSENLQSSIFWDMQNFLHYLSCNFNDNKYTYKYDNNLRECPSTIGYGPVTDFIYFDQSLIWETTIAIFIIFSLLICFLIYKNKESEILFVAIFVSPGIHFLLFSLNSDLFVLVYLIIILFYQKLEFRYINIIFLILLTQIKIYTIGFFLGYMFLCLQKKDYENLKKYTLFFIINLAFVLNHYIFNASDIPAPISFTRSFGIYHDFKILNDYIGYDEFAVLLFFVLILTFSFRKKIFSKFKNFQFSTDEDSLSKIIFLIPTVILINTYQNWGYKFVVCSIFCFLIFNYVDNYSKVYLILLNLISSTYYIIGWGFENRLDNYILILLNKGLFYIFYIYTLLILYKIMYPRMKGK
jgi:hypothetical protein